MTLILCVVTFPLSGNAARRERGGVAGVGAGAAAGSAGDWVLSTVSLGTVLPPFAQALAETGYVVGRNVTIEPSRAIVGSSRRSPPISFDAV
jgi:hypothetical protein